MDIAEIDGSYLEGGGQILRTAIGLCVATGKACRIFNIRRGRSNPGLAAQHLHGVRAAASLCGGRLEGDQIGSQELTFVPGPLEPPDEVHVDVGTAGSVTLVLQCLMIPLSVARKPVEVSISGGTHVAWSPTAEYFGEVFCWHLGRMGVEAAVREVRPGFYPRGGGRLRVSVRPGPLRPVELLDPGQLRGVRAFSLASEELKKARVAERQLQGARRVLELRGESAQYARTQSVGTAVFLMAEYEWSRIGASLLGERGKPAEIVGADCARLLKKQMAAGACLDEHMADQILPYLALSGGRSAVSVARLTDHCRTNMWVIEQLLPVRFGADEERGIITCTQRDAQ